MPAKSLATIVDLFHVLGDAQAEIVDGELKIISPVEDLPSRAGLAIATSLREYERHSGGGRAYPDNAAFIVILPHRRSFSPDASYYIGPRAGGKFLEGAPVFAAEVRSEGDYGPAAEREIAAKRRDYFAAGIQVVWDVDVLREEVVRVYRADDPEAPSVYRRGEMAEAEPALRGWAFPVDELFN